MECNCDLTPEQRRILKEKGTERPFTSPLLEEKRKGKYYSAANPDMPLFSSDDKFDSGTGWPSFSDANMENITTQEDTSHGMRRIEVMDKDGNHLGHVFPDGPGPTGKRYCINGAALVFKPDEE